MKLALIDMDGVICDPTARLERAEQAKESALAGKGLLAKIDARRSLVKDKNNAKRYLLNDASDKNNGLVKQEDMKAAENAYWRTAFDPGLVQLDTLIDGARQALEQIDWPAYHIYFLTSRPETMRQATTDWLASSGIVISGHENYDQLIMKPVSQQYVKTITWKSGVVELLVKLFGVDELLYIDDREDICEAVAALNLPCDLKIAANLQEALAMIGG